MMDIYYLVCSRCGAQLHFRETRDEDGHLVLLTDPCAYCRGAA